MATFKAADIVKVPFPYTDRDVRQRRPALVVSKGSVGGPDLYWVVMITSAEHRSWSGDVLLDDRYREAGLPAPSLIRTSKIATVEANRMEPLGKLPSDLMAGVAAEIATFLR
ncbi:type II toxin-antitoxin system PemK/MazF family toxin [Brevundimonas goettingensis]|uniref:Type II toxin-antitoxin system PemK/MazF family toxin n=1 Tax=Brevundimonas goettingensis TaxID=2774190 RepID=A0A975GWK0_9CAUL|nr:type II toxin-antitoxin system PemK/MazF family toxin [Brevundimonas goettingensis]QTC92697.1 type II toxin-antitoxin system PemK/MazF family toxin [Brevundimonas goettingensis]